MWLLFVLIGYNILSEFALRQYFMLKIGIGVLHVYWLAQMLPATTANYRHVFSSSKSSSAHCLPRTTFGLILVHIRIWFPPLLPLMLKRRERERKNTKKTHTIKQPLLCKFCLGVCQMFCLQPRPVLTLPICLYITWLKAEIRILSFVTNSLWGNECYFVHFSHFWWC